MTSFTIIHIVAVEASRPRDPCGCPVDACSQPRMIYSLVNPAKDVWTGGSDTPSDGSVSHSSEDQCATLFLSQIAYLSLFVKTLFIVLKVLLPFLMVGSLACHDVHEVIAESPSLCRRLSEIVGGDLPSLLSFRSTGDRMWAMTGCLR